MDNNLQMKRKSQYSDDERVRDFQRKLYRKAKQEKGYRFYVLYDKVRIMYFLREAYRRCRVKGGSAGVDGTTFSDVENEIGVENFLVEIQEELKAWTYRPEAMLRVNIPKGNGKTRPIGIPTIKDRVIQMSCKMVIEPIFEADFEDQSYGFRPKRSAHDAVKKIKENLKQGKTQVLDADLSSYFDTIPHKELLYLIGKRISDKNVIHLIKMWLKVPVVENGKISGGKNNKKGTPQGGVISPLLANIYLNVLDKAVNRKDGIFKRNGVTIIRYADDLVLMGRMITAEVEWYFRGLIERMKLTLNEEKTSKGDARVDPFDFLGFTFRYDRDLKGRTGKYWNVIPQKNAEKKLREKINGMLKSNGHLKPEFITLELNSIIRGWLNYFEIQHYSYPAMAKRNLRWYLCGKLHRYYRRKSQRRAKLYKKGAFEYLVKRYRLIDPTKWKKTSKPVNA